MNLPDHVLGLVLAMSGSPAFETVDDDNRAHLEAMVTGHWPNILNAAASVLDYFGPMAPPEVIVVRTPRAYPYSFRSEGTDYIVLDEHFERLAHRWARISELLNDDNRSINLEGYFNELFAERYYLVENLIGCAICAASWYLVENPDGEQPTPILPKFADEERELSFRQRSLGQKGFVVGHECAHILLERLSSEHIEALTQRLFQIYDEGLLPVEQKPSLAGSRYDARVVLDEIKRSRHLALECLCDSLSVAALAAANLPWYAALAAGCDAVIMLAALARMDTMCSYNFKLYLGLSEDEAAPVLAEGARIVRERTIRGIAVTWLANAVEANLRRFGQVRKVTAGSVEIQNVLDRSESLIGKLESFAPGHLFRQHLESASFDPESFVAKFAAFASSSRPNAYRAIGFATAVPRPVDGLEHIDGSSPAM